MLFILNLILIQVDKKRDRKTQRKHLLFYLVFVIGHGLNFVDFYKACMAFRLGKIESQHLPDGSNSMQIQVPGCAFKTCCSSRFG